VGSTNFPLDAGVVAQVVDVMRGLPEGTVILTRGSDGLDQFIVAACAVLGMRCLTYKSAGGAENWNRDVELVQDATEVHGFLSLEDFEKAGRMTGTLHVVEQGLNAKRPTSLYTVVDGKLIKAGET
jgi:hypothetical protein